MPMFQSSQICPDPKCATKMKKEARFCPACGADVKARQANISHNRWLAKEDEFAAEFSIHDLEGFFAKSPLEVVSGQKALIFQNGDYQGEVGQGSYTFESFFGQLNRLGQRKNVRGILLRSHEMGVEINVSSLPTRESLMVEATLNIGISISDATLFSALMMGKKAYTILDLRKLIIPQVKQILSEYTRLHGIREMNADGQLRQQLTLQIKQGLGDFLLGYGLAIGQIQTLAVGHHRFDENNVMRGNAWLEIDELRMKGEIRQQLDSLYSEEEWQKIARMETEQQIEAKIRDIKFVGDESVFVDRLRRIELLDKIRQADVREAVIEDDAQETLAQLEHEASEKHLKRDDEVLNWQQIRLLAEVNYETEREIAAIEQKRIISFARLTLEQETETARLQHKIETAKTSQHEQQREQLSSLQHELEQHQLKGNALLAEKKQELLLHADEMIKREREFEFENSKVIQDLEVTELKNDQHITHLTSLAELHQQFKQNKQKRKEATREQDRLDRAQASTLEIDKINALGSVSQEALIALSDKEQGELIVSLQRTQSMEKMSAEQIMVLVAENSPHVAEALQERYRHANDKAISEQERQLFDKLVQQSKTEADRAERQSSEAQRNLLAMASTLANHQTTPNVIVGGGAGVLTPNQAVTEATPAAAKILVCNKCRTENALNSRYCDNCGNNLS